MALGSALLIGGAVGWALATVFDRPDEALESDTYTFVEVAPGEVGSSIRLNTVAQWTPVPSGRNGAAGVVTSILLEPGTTVSAGDPLYTVGLRPVIAAEGDVPAFRDMAYGANGADVAQLQRLLSGLGHYSGPADGDFGRATRAAVRDWQRSLDIEPDGVVRIGDVIFLPELPARVSLDSNIVTVGATLSGGETVVQALAPAPEFTMPIADSQIALIPMGTRVEIVGPDGDLWAGTVRDSRQDEFNQTTLVLAGENGSAICGEHCDALPVTGQTLLDSRVVTVPSVPGLTVPTAALHTSANGDVNVIDDAGVEHEVRVIASARGLSVVEGVPPGTRVRVAAVGD